jgi:hypothetical protein
MTPASISLTAKANKNSELRLDFKLDNQLIESFVLTDQPQQFRHEFDDAAADHKFEIVLSNKRAEQTKVDQHGQILEDVLAEVYDVKINEIEVGPVFYGQSLYFHDSNGYSKPVVGQFFRQLGCNGTVKFEFSTPGYVWLMENT